MMRIVKSGNQLSSPVGLIIDYQNRTELGHIRGAANTSRSSSKFFLVPTTVELGEIIFDLTAGFQYRSVL